MTDEARILLGSFKEIPIRIISGSITGGRKFVKKEFPSRDTQTIRRSWSSAKILSTRNNYLRHWENSG